MKIVSFGESAKGIRLSGDPKSCEPAHARIAFPGGDVEVVRATDGEKPDYWVHVRINHPEHGMFVPGEDMAARLTGARLDLLGHTSMEPNVGDFKNPALYHLAIRVQPQWTNT